MLKFKYIESGFNLKMSVQASYMCLDCGDIFENQVQAVIHHLQEKHQNFQILGSDYKIKIKS